MVLFHGTANYNLKSFLKDGISLHVRRDYDRPSFCTSESFDEAMFFALRKTPANDREFKNCGIIIEFETSNHFKEGRDFIYWVDTRAIRNEKEVLILNSTKLKVIAYWKFYQDVWNRVIVSERSVASKAK